MDYSKHSRTELADMARTENDRAAAAWSNDDDAGNRKHGAKAGEIRKAMRAGNYRRDGKSATKRR